MVTEGGEGKVLVHKGLGTENPADLMTKTLTIGEIEDRLRGMSLVMRDRYEEKNQKPKTPRGC